MSSNRVDPVSTIVASLPIPELSKVGTDTAKPTYHTLLTVQKELNTNAASIDTTQGTGIHGFLVLTMAYDEFLAMTALDNNEVDDNDEAIPIHHPPPILPDALNARATPAAIRTHDTATYEHRLYHSTDKALKKILLAACPDIYLSAVKHPRTGYSNVTTLQMLTHLWTTYGEIKPDDLDANLTTMNKPWHPTTPIESLFLQIDDGLAFAAAGDSPIDDNTAVRIIYKIVFDTGLFELPCRDWRARPRADKTLTNYKTFFQEANNDRAATTGSVGYHTANAITTTDDKLTSLLASIEKMVKAQTTAQSNKKQKTATTGTTTQTRTPTFPSYCHTHGCTMSYKQDKPHNGHTCKNPGPKHKKDATIDNKMGGNEKIWTAPRAPTVT